MLILVYGKQFIYESVNDFATETMFWNKFQMDIFEVSKRRYIKNNKKVLEVQIFAQPFWDNRDIKWSNNKRFQKGCGEFHERIFRYRWLHGAGRWCVQIICRWIVLLWIHEWLRDIWIILESCIKILFRLSYRRKTRRLKVNKRREQWRILEH